MVVGEFCRGQGQRLVEKSPVALHLAQLIFFLRKQLEVRRTMGIQVVHHFARAGKFVGSAIEQGKDRRPAMPKRDKGREDQRMASFLVINSIMLAQKASQFAIEARGKSDQDCVGRSAWFRHWIYSYLLRLLWMYQCRASGPKS